MSTSKEVGAAPPMGQIDSLAVSSSSSLQRPSRRKIFGGTKTNLKSLRGFITGKSRRERRSSSSKTLTLTSSEDSRTTHGEPTLSTAPTADSRCNDDETVYGMELDSASAVSTVSDLKATEVTCSNSRGAVDIVLLLMDNETRRFELLQVDVDSPTALVKDILVKIPEHATEPSLKFKTFGIVCDRYGQVLDTNKALVDFFTVLSDSSEAVHHTFLLLAVASSNNQSLKGTECAKLAKPILNHVKIAHMLHTLGVHEDTSRDIQDAVMDHVTTTKESVLSIDTKDLQEMTSSPPSTVDTTTSSTSAIETTMTSFTTTVDTTVTSPTQFVSFVPCKSKKASPTSFLIPALVFFIALSIPTLRKAHHYYSTAPLTQWGQKLAPGSWRSQCGLFHLLPTKALAQIHTPFASINAAASTLLATSQEYCSVDSALSLYMSPNGTTLEVYHNGKVIYALVGHSCTLSTLTSVLQSFGNTSQPHIEPKTHCVPGAAVSESGSIEIGGQAPLYAILYDTENAASLLDYLHYWPFGVNVHLPPPPPSNTQAHASPTQQKKGFKFPWEDVKIVWPWEMRTNASPIKQRREFKFPWSDKRVV